jgi:hypothetical protein
MTDVDTQTERGRQILAISTALVQAQEHGTGVPLRIATKMYEQGVRLPVPTNPDGTAR